MMKKWLTLTVTCILAQQMSAQVLINEVCSFNGTGLTDFQGQTEDWVELYNAGSTPQALANYALSDRSDERLFVFPALSLGAGQFVTVFLSGKNISSPELHTGFKLKAGETLYLFDDNEAVIDQVEAGELHLNHSKGRKPDGAAYCYFETPSPGASNNASGAYAGYTADPVFSKAGGFYHGQIVLDMSCGTPASVIHYTVDGAIPGTASPVWAAQHTFYRGRVVRAVAVSPGLLPSRTVTQSYFLNAQHKLPVIHVITDSLHLFDTITGLFHPGPFASPLPPYYGANFWSDTEFPAVVQFFEDEELVFSQDIGMAIHGGSVNRSQPMKSLRLNARKQYGHNTMEYPFFHSRDLTEYKKLVLRNGSSDFCHAQMRDELVSDNLLGTTHNDVLANRPCVVYINGEYWGIYHLREKRGRHNLAALHGVNADSLDILRDNLNEAWKGDTMAFHNMYQYVMSHDMTQNEHFNAFSEMMDMENFADYFISEVYYGNFDWPFNNIEVWRERKAGSKFRYQLFDLDVAFMGTPWAEYHYNLWEKMQSAYCDTNYHINLLEKSLTNPGYYRYFVNRYCDLLNTIFTPQHQQEITDIHRQVMQADMPRYLDRWATPLSQWHSEMDKVNTVNTYRPQIVLEHLRDALTPGNIAHIYVNSEPYEAGQVHINTILLHTPVWEGNYFDSVPVTLKALPKPGYTFKAWKMELNGTTQFYQQPELTTVPADGVRLTAIYTNEKSKEITVFPSPASGSATIRVLSILPEPTRAEVVDLLGRIVYSVEVDHNQAMADVSIDLSHYPPGVYLARVVSKSRVLSAKFICE